MARASPNSHFVTRAELRRSDGDRLIDRVHGGLECSDQPSRFVFLAGTDRVDQGFGQRVRGDAEVVLSVRLERGARSLVVSAGERDTITRPSSSASTDSSFANPEASSLDNGDWQRDSARDEPKHSTLIRDSLRRTRRERLPAGEPAAATSRTQVEPIQPLQ